MAVTFSGSISDDVLQLSVVAVGVDDELAAGAGAGVTVAVDGELAAGAGAAASAVLAVAGVADGLRGGPR